MAESLPQHTFGGRFGPGNRQQPKAIAERARRLRELVYEVYTPDFYQQLLVRIGMEALAGNMAAAREVNQRILGKPIEPDLLERLEAIEKRLDAHEQAPEVDEDEEL